MTCQASPDYGTLCPWALHQWIEMCLSMARSWSGQPHFTYGILSIDPDCQEDGTDLACSTEGAVCSA